MTEADSTPDGATSENRSSSKKPRSPVERAIVWGLIAIFAVVVAVEFRARTGYQASLEYIQKRVDEVNGAGDGETPPTLKISEVKEHLSGGPSLSEGRKQLSGRKLWH